MRFPNLEAFGQHADEVLRVLNLRAGEVVEDGRFACCGGYGEHLSWCDDAFAVATWVPWPTDDVRLLYGRAERKGLVAVMERGVA